MILALADLVNVKLPELQSAEHFQYRKEKETGGKKKRTSKHPEMIGNESKISPRAVSIHAVLPHHHRLDEFIVQRTLQRGLRCRLDGCAILCPKVKECVACLRVQG